jgi:hypothetical protein
VGRTRTRRAPRCGAALKITAVAWTAFMIAAPTLAQTVGSSAPSSTADPSVKELQKEIRKRDALIESLARRVANLEKQVNNRTTTPATSRPVVTRAVATSSVEPVPPVPSNVSFSADQTAQVQTPTAIAPASPAAPAAPSSGKPPAPGQFEVSPEAAERALERTLVATGNVLVPSGFAEIEPLVSYSRRETPLQVLFNLSRNELFPALDLRLGLPWETQLEVALPWNFDEQQVTDVAVSPPQLAADRWGNAIGDFTVAAAKQFVHESGWIPSLLGRVTWEAPTGPVTANGVPMNSGADRLGFSVTALKRQDPLVFVATGGYTRAFEANNINPGNQFNFTTGAFLATSPETSLRAVLTQNFVQDVTVNGITIPGSNTVQPIMTFGGSTILGRGLLVDLQVGLGLTNSAPKYQVVLSSTYRFGVPFIPSQ